MTNEQHAEDVQKYLDRIQLQAVATSSDSMPPDKQKIVDELNHVKSQLRAMPDAIATLQKALHHAQRELKIAVHQVDLMKLNAMKGIDEKKAAAELLLDAQMLLDNDPNYKNWWQELNRREKNKDECLAQLYYNRDLFSAAKNEARILMTLLENT